MRRLEGIRHEEVLEPWWGLGFGGGNMKYSEIINHPHYEPKRHPRMSREMRAAQFAPYAALSGHASAVRRTAKFAELRSRRVIETNMDDDGLRAYEIDENYE